MAGAVTIEEVQEAAAEGNLASLLLPLDYPLQGYPEVQVPQRYLKMARNGSKLPAALAPMLEQGQRCRIYDGETLLGVGRLAGEEIRFDVGLTGGE